MTLSNREQPELSPERLGGLVNRLLRFPDVHRRFDLTRASAATEYGFGIPDQDLLLSLGIPHVGSGEDVLFDLTDLATMSLYLGFRSARQDAMRFWLRGLRRAKEGKAAYRIGVQASCPAPRHTGTCVYSVHPTLSETGSASVSERRGVRVGELRTRGGLCPERLPPSLVELLGGFRDIEFFFLPTFLALTSDFVLEHRIGDCAATARALVEAATERGLAARMSYGFIASVPFSSAHTWAEVWSDDRWLPVDPLLPKALRDWGIARGDDWPVDLSPLGLYHRIDDEQARLVSHSGQPAQTWLPTEVMK